MMKKSFLAIGVAISLTIAGTAIYSVTQTVGTNNKAILNNTNTNINKKVTPSIQTTNKVSTKTISDTQTNKNDTKQSQSHPILNTQENNNSKVSNQEKSENTNMKETINPNSSNNKTQDNSKINSNNYSTSTDNNKKGQVSTVAQPNNNSTENNSSTTKHTNTQSANSNNNQQNGYTENLSPTQTYSNIVTALKKFSKPNTAFVTNLNNYHLVNGVKYYNVYEYVVGSKKNSWNFDGNYSNFLGAFYVSATGKVLNMQFNQNYSNLSNSEKEAQILEVANQFVSYLPNQSASVSVDMSKSHNFEGYQCYLVHYGANSFYINPSGYIYVSKEQVFY